MERLTSLDLFSGAGGFTEGFRQAGIEMRAALDNWGPAADTHLRNHPGTQMLREDILEFDPTDFRKVDILIGSPPCTEFSYANRGGGGNLSVGMRFVLRYLRFVHDLRPRYWVMENVPRLFQSLPPRIHLRRLGLNEDGHLEIPIRKVLNSADYGAPQKRLRLFSGKFPLPETTHAPADSLASYEDLEPWRTVQDVLDALPDPLTRPAGSQAVHDPNYNLSLIASRVSDHFMNTVLSEEEIRLNRKSKTDHSWYGRMAFPDHLDRPARTVMATQTGISRETLVLEWQHEGRRVYRRPTIRECACFQAFPISYQFWGRTAETRYKLVGNAVPPPMAFAVGKAILLKLGRKPPLSPIVQHEVGEFPEAVEVARRIQRFQLRRFPANRRFRDHLPGSRSRGLRVDFDNDPLPGESRRGPGDRGPMQKIGPKHATRWVARLYSGSGKGVRVVLPTLPQAVAALAGAALSTEDRVAVRRLAVELTRLAPRVADASTMQAVWAGKLASRKNGPDALLWSLAEAVDRAFPLPSYEGRTGPLAAVFPDIGRTSLPLRTAAFLAAASYAADVANARVPWSSAGRRALDRFELFEGGRLRPQSAVFEAPDLQSLISTASAEPLRGKHRGSSSLDCLTS